MKLLFDNQLPVALARSLQALGWDSLQVSDIKLDAAADHIIWEYAINHHVVIVTKDADFAQRSNDGVPRFGV